MPQVDTTASFGYWIRRQRLALDLTQAELARQVGCATVTISKIERDERRPSRQMAGLLADNLAIANDERDSFFAAALGEKAIDRMPMAAQPLESLLSEPQQRSRSNLPVPPTPFVGRSEEIGQLTRRLRDPDCRLLTMVGPGGFGKTRLAIRLGEHFSRDEEALFPNGVFFAALEGLESRDLVVPAIAAALDFTFYEQADQKRQLLNYLAGKRLLLILDNTEHILDSALVEEILEEAPQVKIMATSREALNLQQEWFHPIGGMGLTDLGLDREGAADAIRLFQQCARRSRPDFDLTRDLVHVQRICHLVDGAPLAIELAAAWLRALSSVQIVHELERSLDFLATSLHNIPARHRSMRAVLEQTWDYLTAEERQVFRQLSVFVGGFRADAAEAVAGTSIQMLAGLVEKSMLQLRQDGRYRIHALLRQMGAEKLAAHPQELDSVQARHCDVYMALLRDRRRSIAGPDQKAVLAEVQADLDNIRAAWVCAARRGRLEELGLALPCLFRFFWTRGGYEEGERLATLALDELDTATLTDEQLSIQISLTVRKAQFSGARGVHGQALAMLDDALAAAMQIESLHAQALCLYVAGMIAEQRGDGEPAVVENLDTAYRIYQNLNDSAGIAESAMGLGWLVFYLKGDFVTGRRLVDESLGHFRVIGDISRMAEALDRAGVMCCISGEIDAGEAYYRESLRLAQDVANRLVVARAIGGLGYVAWIRSQWELAIQLLLERLESMQDLGHQYEVYMSLDLLCGIFAHARRYSEAKLLMGIHPDMWRTARTAQNHVGAGAYEEAMSYLPQETAMQLAASNTYRLAMFLIAWSMLLASDCPLVRRHGPSAEPVSLAQGEQFAKALEILSFLRAYDGCEAATRMHAEQLFAEMQGEALVTEHQTDSDWYGDHSIEDLAQEMLTLRLE